MKKIYVKRLMYHSPNSGRVLIGGITYDGKLSNNSILNSVHEVGKTAWIGNELWLIRGDSLIYRITVESFPQFQKSWYDIFLDRIRRI